MRSVLFVMATLSFGMLSAAALAAQPAAPEMGNRITALTAGVLCTPRVTERAEAPDTTLGFTGVVTDTPKFTFEQQQVPATLGMTFGLIYTPKFALINVRNLTYRPNATEPDVFYSDVLDRADRFRGFSFDYANELALGVWRLEGWQGDVMLYRVEFEVVAPEKLPEVSAYCMGMS